MGNQGERDEKWMTMGRRLEKCFEGKNDFMTVTPQKTVKQLYRSFYLNHLYERKCEIKTKIRMRNKRVLGGSSFYGFFFSIQDRTRKNDKNTNE